MPDGSKLIVDIDMVDPAAPQTHDKEISLERTPDGYTFTVKEHVANRREWSRTILASFIVGSLVFIVIGAFVSLWRNQDTKIEEVREMVHVLISPVIGIVGAVLGFYFGEKNSDF